VTAAFGASGLDQALVRLAAALSLAAAALHAALVQQHLQEWWGYGLFFVVASVAQGGYGLLLFALPARPRWDAAQWRAWRRGLYAAGMVGNLAVIGLYVVTRTVGIPWFGPAAGEVEAIGDLDLATKGAELLTVACLALLTYRVGREAAAPVEGASIA
jgi:hypothetical protein